MAKTIESQEIWEFKNPEELAMALEKNSNNKLAERVRGISGAVKDNSIDLRKKLQDELTDQEQIEIRKTLKWSWVGTVFTKWMTPEEIQDNIWREAIAGVVWAEGASIISKWEWYMKSLSDAWETAGNLFNEWKYMAAIWVFLKWLFWSFDLKTWNKKDEKKEEGKDWEGKVEVAPIDKISLPMKMIVTYSYKWTKENQEKIINISQTDNFKKLSLKEINNISQNENLLKDWVKQTYQNGWVDLKNIKDLFQLFSSSGNAYKTLSTIHKNWFDENKKIIELLTPSKENKDMYIYEKFSNLDAFSFVDWGIGEFIKLDQDWIQKWEFISNGINGNILTFILANQFKLWDNVDTLLMDKTWSINKNENEKIREIVDFWNKINTLLKTNPQINLGSKIDLTGSLDLKDITKLYIMLWAESDFNNMNEFQQSFLYFVIPGLLWEKWSRGNIEEGWYTAKLWIKIKDATLHQANSLPEWVNRFFSHVWNKIIEYSIEFLKSVWLKVTWGAGEIIKEYPWLVPVMISLVLIYPFTERKTILWALLKKKWIKK